jgi:hypothetical protein
MMTETNNAKHQLVGNFDKKNESSQYVHPISLPLTSRIDIVIKYMSLKHFLKQEESNWLEKLYNEHIKVFNGFVENDGVDKLGKKAFISSFKETIESIKVNGYLDEAEPIPLGQTGIPLDGAHRIAACLYFNTKIKVCASKNKEYVYNYKFFLNRGLKRKYIDPVAIEYCKLVPNSFVAIVYPSALGKDQIIEGIFSRWGNIFYRKEVRINKSGARLLMREFYAGEEWLGSWKTGFSGANSKASSCFQGGGGLARVFVINSSLERMIRAKEEIRELFNLGKHSVHITDTQDESIRLAQVLLNDNSVYFLNHAKSKYFPNFYTFLEQYKSLFENGKYDIENYCIDGSSVLSAFGIRDSRDLDYLHHSNCQTLNGGEFIHSHNEEAKYYNIEIADIISDPSNYFYFDGVKLVSLNIIYGMKKKRSEVKDLIDVKKIDLMLGRKKTQRGRLSLPRFLNLFSVQSLFFRLEIFKTRLKYYIARFNKIIKK